MARRPAASNSVGALDDGEEWEGLRRQQEAIGAAHAQRLQDLGARRGLPEPGMGGASAALLRFCA